MPRKRAVVEPEHSGFNQNDVGRPNGQESPLELAKTTGLALPHATHSGELKIGDVSISCAVLENGTRVLTQRSFLEAIGKTGRPRKKAPFESDDRPAFLSASNLEPFISDELRKAWIPIPFRLKGGKGGGGPSYGYRAELLPQVCSVYLEAADAGQLKDTQMGILRQCQILIRGLATVGIVALVDEATGYQKVRERDALQKILEAYIAKELLPWTARFPDEFYKQMFRLRGWQYQPVNPRKGPRFAGKLTNEIVYDRLPDGVLEELRNKNPVVKDGQRQYKHHQFLTPEIGNPHLERHLAVVTALMRIAPNWRKFMAMLNRAVPSSKPYQQELEFEDDEPEGEFVKT